MDDEKAVDSRARVDFSTGGVVIALVNLTRGRSVSRNFFYLLRAACYLVRIAG